MQPFHPDVFPESICLISGLFPRWILISLPWTPSTTSCLTMWLLVKGMITMKHSLPANNECPSILGSPKKMWEPWAKPCINPRWSKKADLIMKESTFVCLGSNPVEHVYKFNLYWFIFSCMFHPQPILWYSLCRRCTKIAQTEAKIRPGAQDRLATASQPSWWCRMMSSWWCRQS